MKLRELLNGVDVQSVKCDLETEILGVCHDSRKASKGAIFVAIKGFESDGHNFMKAAYENGASVILSEREPDLKVPYVLVKNSREALALLSANFYGQPSKALRLIGITGTNGKTTTSYLIKTILEKTTGKKVGLIGTNQNMIGDEIIETERTTPESADLQKLFSEMRDKGCTYVVMEVSSHSLSLGRVAGLHFEVGVFTNLTQDHLDFHGTMEEYKNAKAKLFDQSSIGIINMDDKAGESYLKTAPCKMFSYSANKNEADLVAKNIQLRADSVKFEAVIEGQIARMILNIPGMFSVYNALSAIGCLLNLGLELSDIASAIKEVKGVVGRTEVVKTGTDYTVMIDYAHTPDGVENILKAARGFSKGRVVALFGCGGDRDRTKRPKMGQIAQKLSDFVIVTSDNPRTENPTSIINDILTGMSDTKCPYVVIPDRREAIVYALENAKPNDTIILMGKGHETYQEINHVKFHLDEREEISQYFAKKH